MYYIQRRLAIPDSTDSRAWLAKTFIVCCESDRDHVDGKYLLALEDTERQDRIIVGPAGAHNADFFIDLVTDLETRYLRYDDNLRSIRYYDVHAKKLSP